MVSRFGALLRMHSPVKMGSALTLTNSLSKEEEVFRVVWIGERQPDGWDIGVEAANPREDFWGTADLRAKTMTAVDAIVPLKMARTREYYPLLL